MPLSSVAGEGTALPVVGAGEVPPLLPPLSLSDDGDNDDGSSSLAGDGAALSVVGAGEVPPLLPLLVTAHIHETLTVHDEVAEPPVLKITLIFPSLDLDPA